MVGRRPLYRNVCATALEQWFSESIVPALPTTAQEQWHTLPTTALEQWGIGYQLVYSVSFNSERARPWGEEIMNEFEVVGFAVGCEADVSSAGQDQSRHVGVIDSGQQVG